jgi:hypothetical protein
MARICDMDDLHRTLDEQGRIWMRGGSYFYFYINEWVCMWISDGFWWAIEEKLMKVVVEDWDNWKDLRTDPTTAIADRELDFDVRIEEWPTAWNMGREELIKEIEP